MLGHLGALHRRHALTARGAATGGRHPVSLPVELRRRWAATAVLVVDRGDYVIVRPIPGDPVTALRGAQAGPGASSDGARAAERLGERQGRSGR